MVCSGPFVGGLYGIVLVSSFRRRKYCLIIFNKMSLSLNLPNYSLCAWSVGACATRVIVYYERMKDLSLLYSRHFDNSSASSDENENDDEKNYESKMHEPCRRFFPSNMLSL